MSYRKNLRILVLDDTEEVLQHFRANLDSVISVDGMTTDIRVVTVHVQLTAVSDGKYEISPSTIKAIANVSQKPFDYIITDFGFIGDPQKNTELMTRLVTEQRGVDATDFESGTVYQVEAIRRKFESMASSNNLGCRERRHFRRNFLFHRGPIKIYTNSPDPFACHFASVCLSERRFEVTSVFRKAKEISFILMHEIFYITPTVRNHFSDGFKGYYSKLLGQRLKEEIHVLALESMVKSQHKLRFTETRTAYGKLTAAGIGFGAVVALIGEIAFHSLDGFREKVLETITTQSLKGPVAREMWSDITILIVCAIICYYVFPRWGVRLARQIEDESDKLLDRGGLE